MQSSYVFLIASWQKKWDWGKRCSQWTVFWLFAMNESYLNVLYVLEFLSFYMNVTPKEQVNRHNISLKHLSDFTFKRCYQIVIKHFYLWLIVKQKLQTFAGYSTSTALKLNMAHIMMLSISIDNIKLLFYR